MQMQIEGMSDRMSGECERKRVYGTWVLQSKAAMFVDCNVFQEALSSTNSEAYMINGNSME